MSVPYYGDFAEDATVRIPFNTFSSDDPSASVTITDLADADLKVHKDGSTDEIVTDGASVVINFDSITGNHMVTIDTSVDAAYTTGAEYAVRMEGTTIDGATVNAWIGAFSIERAGGVLAILKAGTVDVNTKTITAGAIANASFNADVGSTAHGTNIIALACRKILEELNLDHLLKVDTGVAADGDLEAFVVAGTVMAHLLATGADATTFKASTDSLQSIRDHIGDGTNLTEAGGTGNHLTELALSAAGNTAVIDEFETQSAADPTGFKVNVMEVNGTAQTANDNGADINEILTNSTSAAAWGYINSGIVFRGIATAGDTTHATIGGLAGQGAGAFVDVVTPWYGYVFRDSGGAGAAPQGETQTISGYNNATGEFTFAAPFTTAIAANDDIIIMSGRVAAIPEILEDTGTTLPSILGALDDAAAVKTAIEAGGSHLALIKAVTDNLPDSGALTTINTNTARLTAARAGALTDWIDGGRLDLLLDAIPTTAMRGTDNAATEAKQDIIDTVVDAIKVVTDALTAAGATKLALSAGTIVTGTVSHDNSAATTTEFWSDDITEATADHFNGRIVIFTSGDLQYQATDITDYELDTGEGHFTVTALTEAPADNVTFIIV